MTISRRFAFATLAAPLALGLAACGGSDVEELSGEPMDPIAAPEGQSWTDVVEVTEADGYLLGNPDAPLRLVEYASLTCGACAQFAMTGAQPLKEQYVSTGLVSYELRNQIHNAFDLTLAALARCSAPESFHPLSDQVWGNFGQITSQFGPAQQAIQQRGQMEPAEMYPAIAQEAGMLDFFAARGISRDQARACLADSESVLAIGERSDEQSAELGISSTPTFILNDRVLDERSWTDLEGVLQAAGAVPAES